MKVFLRYIRNRSLIFVGLIVLIALSPGCSPCNKRAFIECSPRNIGVVIGHDIKAKPRLTTGETILVGALSGGIGAIVAELSTKETRLEREKQINDILEQQLLNQLKGKGYNACILCAKAIKWDLFENTDDKSKKVYTKLVKKYELESTKDNFDAITFVEYVIEVRFSKNQKLEELSIDDMKPGFTASKIWIYGTKTHQNLYYEFICHGYPTFAKERVSQAAEALVKLKDIPTIAEVLSSEDE